jgi:hypothetical protein
MQPQSKEYNKGDLLLTDNMIFSHQYIFENEMAKPRPELKYSE